MSPDAPLRGADAVNDELEVGFDEPFERRWRVVEHLARGGMLLIVLAALGGFFGEGPFSHRTHKTPDGRLAVDYEPLARFGTTTQVTLHLSSSAADGTIGHVRVFVSTVLVEPLGLQKVLPTPDSTEAVGGGIIYTFAVPPGVDSALVRFQLMPSTIGPVRVDAHQGDEALTWTQWVLP